LFTNAGRLWLHGRISFSAFVKRQSFRAIGGGTSEILKEILGKKSSINKTTSQQLNNISNTG
jgi:hypothetical protein